MRFARLSILVIGYLILGCSSKNQKDTATATQVTEGISTSEVEVLRVALADFLSSVELDNKKSKTNPIVVHHLSADVTEMRIDIGINGIHQLNADTHSEGWKAPKEVGLELIRRNTKGMISLSGLSFGEFFFVTDDKSLDDPWGHPWEAPETCSNARGYVHIGLPGYSKDGNTAVARFSFGPTPHGATATYLSIKTHGGWTVKYRSLAYYV